MGGAGRVFLRGRPERHEGGQRQTFLLELQLAPSGQMIWRRKSKVPLRNKNNEVIGLLGFYEDVTERKEAEEEVRKLSIAIEQSPASPVITDLEARIQCVNPRFTEVTGYSAVEAFGQNPRILQSGQTAKEIYQELWGKLTSGQTWKGEIVNKRKNNEIYWEDSQIAPIKNLAGLVTHHVAVKLTSVSAKGWRTSSNGLTQRCTKPRRRDAIRFGFTRQTPDPKFGGRSLMRTGHQNRRPGRQLRRSGYIAACHEHITSRIESCRRHAPRAHHGPHEPLAELALGAGGCGAARGRFWQRGAPSL